MFVFYSALQLAIFISENTKIQNSASVVTMINTLNGIINLSSLDKQALMHYLKLPENVLEFF